MYAETYTFTTLAVAVSVWCSAIYMVGCDFISPSSQPLSTYFTHNVDIANSKQLLFPFREKSIVSTVHPSFLCIQKVKLS